MNDKQIITQAAQRYGVDPKILWGLYGTESSFGHNPSRSSAGAVGPFQFLPSTAKGMGVDPYNFKSAAFGAARYLSQYKNRGVGGMLSAYNAGPAGGFQKAYVDTTLKNAQSYGTGAGRNVGGMPQPKAPTTTSEAGTANAGSGSTFDQAAFRKASTDYSIGSLFSAKERKGNPLFETGILPSREPQRSEFSTEGPEAQPQPAKVVKQGNVSVFVPPSAGEGAVRFGQQHIGKFAETGGKNLGPELNQLEQKFGMTGEPWCAIFATTAAAQGGAGRGVRTASVAQINEWASQGSHGYERGLKPASQAQPGDLLTFGSQHVGLVKSRHGNTITTIEGNANGSGGVRERTRSVNEGQIARPLYRSK